MRDWYKILSIVKETIINGNAQEIECAIQNELENGCEPFEILNAMTDAMSEIGENFSRGEAYVPEMLVSARTMSIGVNVLKPLLSESTDINSKGKIIIGSVEGDLHDIGKNLVAMMIESSGFEIIDLGVDVSIDNFVQAVKENPDVKIVGLSALLTTAFPSMENTVNALRDCDGNFKIIVGGAPVTQEFADTIGADAYSEDAGAAAIIAKSII